MVIHTVSYNDNGKVRPVLYRASLSEMFIPYGDPRPPYHRKAVFDLGEYGIGFNADKQTQNEDVIGAVKFFDGVLNNSTGDPIRYQRIISIREEDAGILWKHVDYRTGILLYVLLYTYILLYIYCWYYRRRSGGQVTQACPLVYRNSWKLRVHISLDVLSRWINSTPNPNVWNPKSSPLGQKH